MHPDWQEGRVARIGEKPVNVWGIGFPHSTVELVKGLVNLATSQGAGDRYVGFAFSSVRSDISTFWMPFGPTATRPAGPGTHGWQRHFDASKCQDPEALGVWRAKANGAGGGRGLTMLSPSTVVAGLSGVK